MSNESAQGQEHQGGMCRQCDPGIWDYRMYTFMQGSTLVAKMLVPHTADTSGSGYQVGYEYWTMSSVPGAHATTTVSMADYKWRSTPPAKSTVTFAMVQAATWSFRQPSLVDPLLVNPTSSIGIQWRLTQSGSTWGGSIIWSQCTPSGSYNALFGGSTATQTFTDVTTVPGTLTYCATVLPQAVP